jgi:hypothetical protein
MASGGETALPDRYGRADNVVNSIAAQLIDAQAGMHSAFVIKPVIGHF